MGSDTRAEVWPGAVDGPGTATVPGAAGRALEVAICAFPSTVALAAASGPSKRVRLLRLSLMASHYRAVTV